MPRASATTRAVTPARAPSCWRSKSCGASCRPPSSRRCKTVCARRSPGWSRKPICSLLVPARHKPAMRVSSYPGWRAPIRTCAIAIGLAATLLLLARVGYWRMFSIFHFYDDEGCILITVRSFIDGHALYDDVFSMYGPLPVLLKWVLFTATGQPVGHDAGRLLSLASWLATSALAGAIALRLTGSLVAGCVGMVFVFQGLGLTTWEPGHPQELCALLLVLVVLLATFVGLKSGRRAVPIVAALGIAAGCLAMSKINVFVFLMLALGAAALAFTPRTRLVVALDIIYAVGLLAAPTMLMRDRLDAPGVR